MQFQNEHRISPLLITLLILPVIFATGCGRRPFRVATLPSRYGAPAPLDLAALNLSGMAGPSVSVDVIQPGDVLDVSVITDFTKLTTTTAPVRVADDGTAIIPLVGRVGVGGMEIKQAEQVVNVESISRGVFRSPCITVAMKEYRTSKVTVVGAVNKPGTHDLPRGSSSLMAALVAAEGLAKDAGTEVEIRRTDARQMAADALMTPPVANSMDPTASFVSYQAAQMPGEPTVMKVDLASASAGVLRVPELRDGDVVHVVKRTLRPIQVLGLVARPGQYAFPTNQEIRVLDALALAGGINNPVAEDIIVIRQAPNEPEPVRIAVSLQSAKNGNDNLTLAPGDTVSIEQTPMTATYTAIQTFFRVSLGGTMSWF